MAGMRLNAYLARAGVASRRGADELIKAGRVTVNGEPGAAEHVRRRARPRRARRGARRAAAARLRAPAQACRRRHDRARPAGPAAPSSSSSTTRPASCPSAGSTPTRPARCCSPTTARSRTGWPIPRYGVEKVYEAEVEGEPSDEALAQPPRRRRARRRPDRSREGAAPRPSTVELTLHEGRKHQVKRMLAAVGHPVTRLHRSRYAGLTSMGSSPAPGASSSPPSWRCSRPPPIVPRCLRPLRGGAANTFVVPGRTAYVIAASAADWTISACACAIQASA